MAKNEELYYNYNNLLSHNRIFNFIVGVRGGGKTYGAKKKVIKNFIKNKEQFIYVRRYKTEMLDLSTFFADIGHEFPNYELTVKGNSFYCNGDLMGKAITLSTSGHKKSSSYPNVTTIIYDEFLIPQGGVIHYMKNEPQVFLELYETIARTRTNVRAIFIGNNFSLINPYFTYFNVNVKISSKVQVFGEIAVETYSKAAFKEMKLQTPYGRLIANTDYGNYAMDNKPLEDSEVMLKDINDSYTFRCNMIYMGRTVGVWSSPSEGSVILSYKHEPLASATYSITTVDHKPNVLFAKNNPRAIGLKLVKKAWNDGVLYFETQAVKKDGIEIIKII